MKNLLEGEEIR